MKCQHEIPCICDEYLNRLTQKELMNLRIQFGTVITNARQAFATRNAVPVLVGGWPKPNVNTMNRIDRREAAKSVKKINKVLEEKFGYIVL